MCGIAGYYVQRDQEPSAAVALRMIRSIAHRGPDDEGFALIHRASDQVLDCSGAQSDPRVRKGLPSLESVGESFMHDVAFAHRRYSIVDLTPGGHQPMWDANAQVCVSFNGEVFNFVELREELTRAGRRFRTSSDTEVLLEAYLEWGTDAFARLNGPCALSLYDRRTRRVLLARDRLGKAPLYFAVHRGGVYWASEIKGLLIGCGADAFAVRGQAVDDYVKHGWRDLDGTFWHGVEDFPPGSWAWLEPGASPEPQRYWTLPVTRLAPLDISVESASARLRDLLTDAIRIRMRADVPVAFELSGGMDSSSLVALAVSGLESKLVSYTVKYADKESDEEPFARGVAQRFGDNVDYRVLEPGLGDFWRDADRFVFLEEEPFHAPSLHANQLVRRLMRAEGAKVVITGAAGDEVLAGYASQYFAPFLGYLLRNLRFSQVAQEIRNSTEYPLRLRTTLGLVLGAISPGAGHLLRGWRSGESEMVAKCYRPPAGIVRRGAGAFPLSEQLRWDMGQGRMNYWLRSGNKAHFGIPIEPRAPFLDYRVVEFAFQLPLEYLIHNGWHKWILRNAMQDLLPDSVVWRRAKMGFPFPLVPWLKMSRPIALGLISDSTCPYLDVRAVQSNYDALTEKTPVLLWRLLSLGLWWRRVIENRPLAV